MKKIIIFTMISALVLSLHSCVVTQNGSGSYYDEQPVATVTYQTFYDELSPYGRWIDYPGYGYAWSPFEQDFRPYYTNGYWMNTNMGWSWNSNYNWGWAPFHYGRWFYETGYGWLWLPGYEWAPAWVMWRNNDDYYGWAPLAPGMMLGASIGFEIPYEHWAFVDHRYLVDRDFRNHCVEENRNETVYRNTSIINNISYTKNRTVYATGPKQNEVERFSGQSIAPVTVRQHQQINAPVVDNSKKEIKVYRPEVRTQPQQQEVIKPKNIVLYKDIPHDNGKRGTWSMPTNRPANGNGGNKNNAGKSRKND